MLEKPMQNLDIIEKAKNGDSAAFSEIYDLFADRIFKYIRFKITDQAEAEDILQQTFIKAWKGISGFKIEPEANFSAWLYRIAQNTINDYLRKIYRMPDIGKLDENLPVYENNSAAEIMDQQAHLQAVKEAFEFLPVQYKEIIELRYIQDLSIAEVCKITGKSNLAVRLVQHRALKKLQQILGEKYGMEYGKI